MLNGQLTNRLTPLHCLKRYSEHADRYVATPLPDQNTVPPHAQ